MAAGGNVQGVVTEPAGCLNYKRRGSVEGLVGLAVEMPAAVMGPPRLAGTMGLF